MNTLRMQDYITWQGDEWDVCYYTGAGHGRWALEKFTDDGIFISSVSWYIYFPGIEEFIEFLRKEEEKWTLKNYQI